MTVKWLSIASDKPDDATLMVMDDDSGRTAMNVDLTGVDGQLWDAKTVRSVLWGLKNDEGRVYGRVEMRNGTRRSFFDAGLLAPYEAAFRKRHAELVNPPSPVLRGGGNS